MLRGCGLGVMDVYGVADGRGPPGYMGETDVAGLEATEHLDCKHCNAREWGYTKYMI